jgi:hypothetical protein
MMSLGFSSISFGTVQVRISLVKSNNYIERIWQTVCFILLQCLAVEVCQDGSKIVTEW